MRHAILTISLNLVFFVACSGERLLSGDGSGADADGVDALEDIRDLDRPENEEEDEEEDEDDEGGESGGESDGDEEDEEEEHFDMAVEDPPEEPPAACEPGEYGCPCIDPGVYCNEGLVCIGGYECGCDKLGTLNCPCNIDECDDGLSCNDMGFCEA